MARKTEHVMVVYEPRLREILELSIAKSGLSASAYHRKLVIERLKEEGLLTDEMLLRIVEG